MLTVAGIMTYQNNRETIDDFCMELMDGVEQEVETALGFDKFDEIELPLPQQLEVPDDTKIIAQAEPNMLYSEP